MDRFQYLALMAICVVVTLPLELVLGARVWRQPRRLVRALVLPFAVFVAWDVIAIHRGHWSYDTRYVTGWDLPFDLPVEEAVFFLVIPICGLLTYEAVQRMADLRSERASRRTARSVERPGQRRA
jgi:lycopene cyclase domain-containing protein